MLTALRAVRSAGKFLREASQRPIEITSEIGNDIKLQLDMQSEELIIHDLRRSTPFHILSEEEGMIAVETKSEYIWIIDPIDGSLNFSRDIPFYCISLGLWRNLQEPVLGVVYDFVHDALYRGIVGQPAYVNDTPISVSSINAKERAIIATGFPVYSTFDDETIKKFILGVRSFKKVRLFGSAALSLIAVAKGSIEAYQENNIAIWDVAGAIPIVLSAGGSCTWDQGKDKYLFNVLATNGKLT